MFKKGLFILSIPFCMAIATLSIILANWGRSYFLTGPIAHHANEEAQQAAFSYHFETWVVHPPTSLLLAGIAFFIILTYISKKIFIR